MFETVCTYPLPSDLFSQAIHPSDPLIAVGLASGHVQTFRLPVLSPSSPANSETSALSNGCGTIDTIWKTRRHNGSCRSVAYSSDGTYLFSAGTDGLVKMADSQSGRVVSKIAVPNSSSGRKEDNPALLHALTPQTLILGTDSAAVHIYDLREKSGTISSRPASSFHPHDDYISSITPLPPSETSTSGFPKQWVSSGGTTLAVTDVRKGVIARSEDQEEELLSSCLVSGLPKRGTSVGTKVVVGGAGGVLTLWEKGVWDDQDERIVVDSGRGGGESLDVLANVPEALGRHLVAVGLGNGAVRIVQLGINRVIAEAKHDELEGVIALGFEAEGRMISGGGQIVKVWQQAMDLGDDETEILGKRQRGSDSDSESNEDSDSSEEEPRQRQRKKKKKRKNAGSRSTNQNEISFGDLD